MKAIVVLCFALAIALPAAAPQSGGKVPESQWLIGDALGWRGPWGTTYPTNLRLYMQDLSEEQWVKKGKTLTARPPMPWFNVRDMTRSDLRAFARPDARGPVRAVPRAA